MAAVAGGGGGKPTKPKYRPLGKVGAKPTGEQLTRPRSDTVRASVPAPGFRPTARLNPSQVRDDRQRRSKPLLSTVGDPLADALYGAINDMTKPPPMKFKQGSSFDNLQRSFDRFTGKGQPTSPKPGPAPLPAGQSRPKRDRIGGY